MGSLTDRLGDIEFSDFIDALYDGGWFEYVFPFLLVYAVVLTILNKVEIFDNRKGVRVIIALVLALFSIAFPITGNFDSCTVGKFSNDCETLGSMMMVLFPGVTAFSMGILALYIVVAMLGLDLTEFFGKGAKENDYIKYILGGIGLFVVIYYYARGFGWGGFENSDNWLFGQDGLLRDPLFYMLIVGGGIFYWISKDDGDPKSGSSKSGDK